MATTRKKTRKAKPKVGATRCTPLAKARQRVNAAKKAFKEGKKGSSAALNKAITAYAAAKAKSVCNRTK